MINSFLFLFPITNIWLCYYSLFIFVGFSVTFVCKIILSRLYVVVALVVCPSWPLRKNNIFYCIFLVNNAVCHSKLFVMVKLAIVKQTKIYNTVENDLSDWMYELSPCLFFCQFVAFPTP